MKLKQGVYQKSNGNLVIDDQSEEVIVSIMRNMYLEHSKNLNTNISNADKTLKTIFDTIGEVIEKEDNLLFVGFGTYKN